MASSSSAEHTSDSRRPAAGKYPVVGRWRDPSVAIAVTGAGLGLITFLAAPLVNLNPNRVVEGVALSGFEALGIALGAAVVALWLLSAALSFVPQGRVLRVVRVATGLAIFGLMLWGAGSNAAIHAAEVGTPAARTSFGLGFYLALFSLFLVQYAALAEGRGPLAAAGTALGHVGVILALAVVGSLSDLGIVREYQLAADTFAVAIRTHFFYAIGVTGAAVLLGVPLGLWSARSRRVESAIVSTLSLGQVFPGLAFVGLMMPVLSTASQGLPALRAIGVAGIGWAPVFIVLLTYALYPVTRNTLTAIRQLDPAVIDAAKGMGFSGVRRFAEVELPLALPVIVAGIRIALVQGTAGAVLAAFVGGGGLGTIMFLGLEATSMDLVLVGVVPIVLMALSFDVALRLVESAALRGSQKGVPA